MPDAAPKLTAKIVASKIAEATDTDVLLFNGPSARPLDQQLIQAVRTRRRRKNVLLLLVTGGGAPDPAYRIARCLQEKYSHFTAFVPGYCKSAGTLLVMGAHEIVMSDAAELGPLDVQLSRRDELFERQSGLTATSALSTLNEKAYQAFEHFLLQTKIRGGSAITTKTATEVATRLATGLFSPIYQQIDPLHVGEAGRAMIIAQRYGQLLHGKSENFELSTLDDLISGYPSHGFVIDRGEAEQLFHHVREPNELESLLADLLGERARWARATPDDAIVSFVSDEVPAPAATALSGDANAPDQASAGHAQPAAQERGTSAPSSDSAQSATVTPISEHRRTATGDASTS